MNKEVNYLKSGLFLLACIAIAAAFWFYSVRALSWFFVALGFLGHKHLLPNKGKGKDENYSEVIKLATGWEALGVFWAVIVLILLLSFLSGEVKSLDYVFRAGSAILDVMLLPVMLYIGCAAFFEIAATLLYRYAGWR